MQGPGPSAPFSDSVIIHIDLDCFYCQVEQLRLYIPRDTPCAVQQWEGLIAVNYAARAAGVTRHMRLADARKVCPELVTVHVQTIGGEGASDGAEGSSVAQRRSTCKASLQRYRQASGQIMRLLMAQAGPGCVFEKVGIDEAFLDVTPLVRQCLQRLAAASGGGGGSPGGHAPRLGRERAAAPTAPCALQLPPSYQKLLQEAEEASVVEGAPLNGVVDQHLAMGAYLALRLRRAVADALLYSCSAGVASNKMLAKIGSARNKPDKQTLVLPRAVPELMQDLPVGKIWGLGGKLGAALEALGATTAGQAQGLSWGALAAVVGDKAKWVADAVRGVDTDPVTPHLLVKSINSCKSFEPSAKPEAWLPVLAAELAERLEEQQGEYQRRARTLVLQYRGQRAAADRSVRCAMPLFGREGPNAPDITAAAGQLFARVRGEALPCVRLALSATDFSEAPAEGNSSIARFLAPAAPALPPQQAAAVAEQPEQPHGDGGSGQGQPDGEAAHEAEGAGTCASAEAAAGGTLADGGTLGPGEAPAAAAAAAGAPPAEEGAEPAGAGQGGEPGAPSAGRAGEGSSSRRHDSGGTGSGPGPQASAPDVDLGAVDLAEQAHIMRDIQVAAMRRGPAAGPSRGGGGAGTGARGRGKRKGEGGGGGQGGGKQTRILSFAKAL